MLEQRFNNKKFITNSILKRFFSQKNIVSESSNAVKELLDTTNECLNALKNIGIVTDNWDVIVLYILSSKLDTKSRELWETKICNLTDELPTLNQFFEFLEQRFRSLEFLINKPVKSTQSHHVTFKEKSNCVFCSDSTHKIGNCKKFAKGNLKTRREFVQSSALCFNCLGANHSVEACRLPTRCKICKRKHHSLLHYNASVSTDNVSANNQSPEDINVVATATTSRPEETNIENITTCFTNTRKQVLLATALVRANNNSGSSMTLRALLDQGSQASFITESAVDGSTANKGRTSVIPTQPHDVTLCSLSNCNASRTPTTVLLATARVVVFDTQGREHNVRALLDSASQSNFASRSLCQRLGLETNQKPSCSVVKGIGGTTKPILSSVSVKFFSRFDLSVCFSMDSLVVDKVTERLPTVSVDISSLINFNNLPLADDTYAAPGDIDLLIGASIFPHLLLSRKVQGQSDCLSPVALETVLGYVIVGSAPALVDNHASVSYCCATDPLDAAVRKFWQIEEVSAPQLLSPDDKACEDIYSSTTTRDTDGRYMVALPFKGDVFSLGDSFKKSKNCFLCLERKMQASPKLKEAYDNVISEYLNKGYISPAPLDTEETRNLPSYTIPHHGIIREDKLTSKLRIVLDGSSKSSSQISLNDILYNGQNLQGNLFHIIVNFRLFRIALSADIRQMFLCIGVRPCDRRFQRILYRFSPQEPLKVYEFNRVCFGLKSSPFHALRTIKQLVLDEGSSYPRAQQTVKTGLYMDDFVYSIDNEDEAISTAAEVIALMKAGQFDLVKWTSNSQRVLDSITPSHRLSAVKEFDDSDSHKVLGLCWSPATDNFSLKICTTAESCTKRTILSCVARIWDVMGFVAPVVLYAKLLIKQLWLCECDWDDIPPDHIIQQWSRFKEELPLLGKIKIPRHVGIASGDVLTVVGFADASERAYGGVVYFHVRDSQGLRKNSFSLISAKSKVSPRKVVSLARLELCAILVLSNLIANVINTCNNSINIDRVFAFSDSTVALCWVHSSPHRWDTFVANRVSKIQNEFPPRTFYHIAGHENPADCLSRGLSPAQIIDHPLWFCGPQWILSDPSFWPVTDFNPSTVSQPPEVKKHVTLFTAEDCEKVEKSFLITLANRFSSWSKLLRIVVYICRFVKLLPRRSTIIAADLDYAENLILSDLQRSHFFNEIASLRTGKRCTPAFQRLKPFLQNKLLRVRGRLSNADIKFDSKHPLILPRKGHILNLIVDYYHKLNCHAGPELLMSILRQKYWILSARNLIRSRVHKCLPCFRLRAKPNFPEMVDHRSCRVTPVAKPFVHTGTDYAGPFKVSSSRGRGIRAFKAYVCLFVCLTTRTVHIEVAGDLASLELLSVFYHAVVPWLACTQITALIT
ncbi:uncharacterized protein LOC125059586 [Pieris napi]|uniref:uncharacterized protein LOC125059586 n=1 Tax=Pieris napi TaxID=78633 RepID=UPI001FB91EE7|nr:uncharacterized protein LOC125059586 [Pieris napi]